MNGMPAPRHSTCSELLPRPPFCLVLDALLEDFLVLRRQRRLLTVAPRLCLVERGLARNPGNDEPLPLALEIGVERIIENLCLGRRCRSGNSATAPSHTLPNIVGLHTIPSQAGRGYYSPDHDTRIQVFSQVESHVEYSCRRSAAGPSRRRGRAATGAGRLGCDHASRRPLSLRPRALRAVRAARAGIPAPQSGRDARPRRGRSCAGTTTPAASSRSTPMSTRSTPSCSTR